MQGGQREVRATVPAAARRTGAALWHSRVGTPWTARLDTVEFVKQREVLGRRLFVVEFEADHVRNGLTTMQRIVQAERLGGSWIARGVTGAGIGGDLQVQEPHVNLGGSWGRFGFCGGGRVHDPASLIDRVRLRFESGIECEDDTEAGWVLFYTDRPVRRPQAKVELVDASGQTVASYGWPPQRDLPQTLLARLPRR